MKERVGNCAECQEEVYCLDGFFNGVVLEEGIVRCFTCHNQVQLNDILNSLLEAEKAGVEALDFLMKEDPSQELFPAVKQDEAWSCKGLIACIQRENGKVSTHTGNFAQKLKNKAEAERLAFLNKGQGWVVRKIDEALTLKMNEETRSFLMLMKEKHEENITKCDALI